MLYSPSLQHCAFRVGEHFKKTGGSVTYYELDDKQARRHPKGRVCFSPGPNSLSELAEEIARYLSSSRKQFPVVRLQTDASGVDIAIFITKDVPEVGEIIEQQEKPLTQNKIAKSARPKVNKQPKKQKKESITTPKHPVRFELTNELLRRMIPCPVCPKTSVRGINLARHNQRVHKGLIVIVRQESTPSRGRVARKNIKRVYKPGNPVPPRVLGYPSAISLEGVPKRRASAKGLCRLCKTRRSMHPGGECYGDNPD